MIDNLVKKLDKETCLEQQEKYQNEFEITNRRLARLRHKQWLYPSFESYDVWADEMVDLPTRIAEFEAIKGELGGYLKLVADRLQTLKIKEENPSCKIVKQGVAQLSLLD